MIAPRHRRKTFYIPGRAIRIEYDHAETGRSTIDMPERRERQSDGASPPLQASCPDPIALDSEDPTPMRVPRDHESHLPPQPLDKSLCST